MSNLRNAVLIALRVSEEMPKDVEFEVVGDAPEKAPPTSAPEPEKSITNGNKDSAQPSTSTKGQFKALNLMSGYFFFYVKH